MRSCARNGAEVDMGDHLVNQGTTVWFAGVDHFKDPTMARQNFPLPTFTNCQHQ